MYSSGSAQTTVARPPLAVPSAGPLLAALALAAAVGALAGLSPRVALVAMLALGLYAAVIAHPPFAAYSILVSTLLLVGIDRGVLMPLLRPSEAVLLVAGAGLATRGLYEAAAGHARRLRLTRIDAAIVFMAIAASVVPLLWMAVRGREIAQDDLLYSLQLWKYYAIFLCVRWSITTERQVGHCLWAIMAAAAVVAGVAVLQALGLAGVPGLLATYYAPFQDTGMVENMRGTSLLASSIAVADVMVFSLAIAAGWLVRRGEPPELLVGLGVAFVFGGLAAAQFSGFIALATGLFAFGLVTGSLGRALLTATPAVLAAGLVLRPAIEKRLSGFETLAGLPPSWLGRLENLRTYFLPEIGSQLNWVTGVRPAARVAAPETWRDWVFIEGGYIWLVWTGGLLLLASFFVFMWTALRRVARIARERTDAVGVAAIASFTALVVTAVTMLFDPHLTLRGSAEVSFTLLALALLPQAQKGPGSERSP